LIALIRVQNVHPGIRFAITNKSQDAFFGEAQQPAKSR
jgi:hypothetical protein